MITSTHPPAADPESKLRPARYGIAVAVSVLVIVALIASSILNYVFLDSIPGRTSLYGLLAVALITLGRFILVRAYNRDRAMRRKHLIRASVLIGLGVLLWLLVIDVVALGWVGANPPEGLVVTVGQIATLYYFVHFLILFPVIGRLERPKPLPASIATAVLQGGAGARIGGAGVPLTKT